MEIASVSELPVVNDASCCEQSFEIQGCCLPFGEGKQASGKLQSRKHGCLCRLEAEKGYRMALARTNLLYMYSSSSESSTSLALIESIFVCQRVEVLSLESVLASHPKR
jgi:hypothetical protein